MNELKTTVETTLRIPGNWSHPSEFVDRIPDGFRLTPEVLQMPDGTEIEMTTMPADDQFATIFHTSCRNLATADERSVVDSYTVNIGLIGPGGSMSAALTTMQAGAAIVRAGGAGVFIDNSALAHGGSDWIEMTEDGGSDAVSFAFVNIVRGKQEVWTMGLHVMGLPDLLMQRADLDAEGDRIIELIRYMARGEHAIGHGHILGDETGPQFKALASHSTGFDVSSPMHNPFGKLKLVSLSEIAESN